MQISTTVDGKTVTVPDGKNLLALIREIGGDVPTLCHSERLTACASCRICLVEEIGTGYVPACATKVKSGAVYISNSPELFSLRSKIMEMILADHPLLCRGCIADKRCKLQSVALSLGFSENGIGEPVGKNLDRRHPFIHIDNSLCIHCSLCVRACHEIQGQDTLGIIGRNQNQRVVAGLDNSLGDAGCVSCGQCLFECPTGALQGAYETVSEFDKKVSTVCGFCAVGCKLNVLVKGDRITAIEPDPDGSANLGHACVKGRFGYLFSNAPDRLETPLIKQKDGSFRESSWHEAFDLIAANFLKIRDLSGADALAVVSSARCTNEENFILQKFTRTVFKTNNIDNCARVCHSPSAFALGAALGTGAGTNSFEDIDSSDVLLLVGANPTEAHPVLGARIKQAVLKGCKLIVIDPRNTELAKMADIHLPLRPGSNVPVINAMQGVLITENLLNHSFIEEKSEGFAELKKSLQKSTPEWAEQHSGVAAEIIIKAARLYGSGERAQILWGLGITESCQGSVAAFGLINMAIMTGNLGRRGTGSSPIRGQNNVQGACDMGALPNVFSDYRPVGNLQAREQHAKIWGVEPPTNPGMKMPEMLAAARVGSVKGMYLVAQDPAQSDPDTKMVEEAFASLDFLVVQDIFMTESAKHADVILPGASFLEKDGTFVNSDRRVQLVKKAVEPPGEALADGDIVIRLAKAMGVDLGFGSAEDVMAEIAELTPNWGGINYHRLEELGFIQWPCPDLDHPGTDIVHKDGNFIRGLARFTPTPWQEPFELCDSSFPFMLTTGRILFHYNSGSMTRRTPIAMLNGAERENLQIHPVDAARLGIKTGEIIEVVSNNGRVKVHAKISRDTNPGLLFMAFHHPETRTNLLVGSRADEQTLCPEYKVTPVRLEKTH
ncbi:MAG: formate dehydrogenase subunit alpha [Magnetococcales bacterium]|nr:formate dehydrogenase subunit alpha [Magnetococcales bacterium]